MVKLTLADPSTLLRVNGPIVRFSANVCLLTHDEIIQIEADLSIKK